MTVNYPDGFDQSVMQNKPICGVLAVALAAGVAYDVAHSACKRHMPSHAKRFRGGTYSGQREKALRDLGICFTNFNLDNTTVLEFCAERASFNDSRIYLIQIRAHVITFKNGFLIDQSICKPWQMYHHPRIKIKSVTRIDGSIWDKLNEQTT